MRGVWFGLCHQCVAWGGVGRGIPDSVAVKTGQNEHSLLSYFGERLNKKNVSGCL